MNRSETGPVGRSGWDALDGALADIRAGRGMPHFTDRAAELTLRGCGAEAVALGRIVDDVWSPWLQAGRVGLLQSGGAVPVRPLGVADAPALEQQVIRSRRTRSRALSAAPDDRRVVIAAVVAGDRVLGLLHAVGVDLIPEIVQTCASTLGSVLALMAARRQADEQSYVLARLRDRLGTPPEPPIELLGASLGPPSATGAASHSQPDPLGLWDRLTTRQREVLDLMLAGLSNPEIAERLVLAVPTVKSHVRAVLRVSGAVNRSDAVARFARARAGPADRRIQV